MFTADECRAKALEKLELAKANPKHRRRFQNAADAWFFLADQWEVGEAILRNARAEADARMRTIRAEPEASAGQQCC
jgi:hypothetical protein